MIYPPGSFVIFTVFLMLFLFIKRIDEIPLTTINSNWVSRQSYLRTEITLSQSRLIISKLKRFYNICSVLFWGICPKDNTYILLDLTQIYSFTPSKYEDYLISLDGNLMKRSLYRLI